MKCSEQELKALRKCLNEVYYNKYKVPKQKIAVPVEDRVFSQEELDKFFSCVRDPYYRFIFRFLLYTGMRIGEALEVHRDNLDLENCCVYTYLEKKEYRFMVKKYFPSFFVDDFKQFLEWFNPKDKLFVKKSENIRSYFRKVCEEAGLNRYYAKSRSGNKLYFFSLHSFRRTFATRLEETAGLNVASRGLNHANIKTTQMHYAGVRKDRLRQAIEQTFKKSLR